MMWLPDGEKSLICLAVLTQYRRVTVTDRWTDRHHLLYGADSCYTLSGAEAADWAQCAASD